MKPAHGYTRRGNPVHARVVDHHRTDTRYQRFNRRAAIQITENVGTMTCTWTFCVLALCSLPATLVAAKVVPGSTFNVAGLYVASAGLILLVTWAAQSFVQLVLLPALMVGQQLQNAASDARSERQFDDLEWVKDSLDLSTQGGLRAVLDRLGALEERLPKKRVRTTAQKPAKPSPTTDAG